MQNNWIPLTKKTIHTSDGHPDTGSPYTNVLMIIIKIIKKEIIQNIIPISADITSGTVEKAVIPSIA